MLFGFFKKKCPSCKMELREGKQYFEGYGKKFCSENCKEEYRKKLVKEESAARRGSCH